MTTLREYLGVSDLFGEINKIVDFPFITNEPNTPELMNLKLILEYGNRVMFEPYLDLDIATVAKLIINKNRTKWENLVLLEKNNGLFVGKTKSTVADNKVDQNKLINDEKLNKTVAYNETDLFTESGETNTNDEVVSTVTADNAREVTFSIKDLLEGLNEQQKVNIINVATEDVAKQLTLSLN